ncbi:MAG TPA: OB-fold domain-containing protein [Mycobacterium sp.]|nr:OB-fold domain-containing protein [Mycobacterium sp.]
MTDKRIPVVDYLHLSPTPHLTALQCDSCAAQFFGRRNACACCFGSAFTSCELPSDGVLQTYTIVCAAEPGIEVPFIAAVVDCGGVAVAGNLVGVEPDPAAISTGMKVRLSLTSLGIDDGGVEAVGFGFEPAE